MSTETDAEFVLDFDDEVPAAFRMTTKLPSN